MLYVGIVAKVRQYDLIYNYRTERWMYANEKRFWAEQYYPVVFFALVPQGNSEIEQKQT